MKRALMTIRNVSILSILRYSDLFLTLIILSRGGIELNLIWSVVNNNFLFLFIFLNIPLLLYFVLKTYRKLYFRMFIGFNSILIIYEIVLITLSNF